MPQRTRQKAKETDDSAMIWSIMATMFETYKGGWTFVELAKQSQVDVPDLLRLHKQAARGFAALRREFPKADWPIPDDIPVHIIERQPSEGHEDKVIAFKPFRDPEGKVRAEWHSLTKTFIEQGKSEVVRSRRPAALVQNAFKKALACAKKTAGIAAIWVDDPDKLFPREVRQKSR